MLHWLESMAPGYGVALMWTIVALIGLLVLLIIIRIVRGLTFGTFVAGGRNRKARLAVMDATAVDSQRRLVLVRRDDVEHLILIGGPSDVVVEQNIRLLPQARRPMAEEPAGHAPAPIAASAERVRAEPQAPEPAPRQGTPARQPMASPPPPRPASGMAPNAAHAPVEPQPARTPPTPPAASAAEPQPTPPPAARMASVTPPISAPMPSPAPVLPPVAGPVAPAPQTRDLDDALFEELEVTLEKDTHHAAATPTTHVPEPSLDEEMDRLLSDLAGNRR